MFDFYSSSEFYTYPKTAALFLYIVFLLAFPSWYIFKQGAVIAEYMGRAVSLENLAVLSDPRKAEENRRFALRAAGVHGFAVDTLGIQSRSYTSYVELDRGFLAAVVHATERDSFKRYEWRFPFIGRVPYKFFFDAEDARREMVKLDRRGYDVWVRRIGAFSTLGLFSEPLYSFMKDFSHKELADLVIHELIHSIVFVKNNFEFNEGFAEFVGKEGAKLYIDSLEAPLLDEVVDRAAEADYSLYLSHVLSVIDELRVVYDNHKLSREEKLELKAGIISAAQDNFRNSYDEIFATNAYRYYPSLPVNNAFFDLYALYNGRQNWFTETYEKSGKDLRAFIAAAKTVKGKQDPFSEFEAALGLR